MKVKEAEIVLRKWQKLLRLQDWDIDIKLVASSDLPYGHVGSIGWNEETRHATISMLDRIHAGDSFDDNEEEHTIVHELLHIIFIPFRPTDPVRKIQMEQAINTLTRVFLNFDEKLK